MPNRGFLLTHRDERGWRIPNSGTRSREIYDLTLAGNSSKEIASLMGIPCNTVRVLKWKFTQPENSNRRQHKDFVPQIYRERADEEKALQSYARDTTQAPD